MWITLTIIGIVVGIFASVIAGALSNPEQKKMAKGARTIGFLLGALGVVMTITFQCFRTVPAGYVGIEMQFGRVVGVRLPGGHMMNPLATLTLMESRLQASPDHYDAGTKDMQTVKVDMLVNWKIDPSKADALYQKYGGIEQMHARIVKPACQETLKQEISRHQAGEILLNRSKIKTEVMKALDLWLTKYDITLNEVALQDINFDPEYQKVIENKQIEDQKAQTLQYTLAQAQKQAEVNTAKAKGEANAQIETARGIAEAKKIQGAADAEYNRKVAQSLTPYLVQMEGIKAWNGWVSAWKETGGNVPQYITGGAGGNFLFSMPPPSTSAPKGEAKGK